MTTGTCCMLYVFQAGLGVIYELEILLEDNGIVKVTHKESAGLYYHMGIKLQNNFDTYAVWCLTPKPVGCASPPLSTNVMLYVYAVAEVHRTMCAIAVLAYRSGTTKVNYALHVDSSCKMR